MRIKLLKEIIDKELKEYFGKNNYSEEDELNIINEIILGELLNPENSYPYEQENKGLWVYKDMNNVEFFVRLAFQPLNPPLFEFKTGWFDEEGNKKYEPSIPPISKNSSIIDWDKRSDTVAKIYRDEIIPFFQSQQVSKYLIIKPISASRVKFAERLVKKFTPTDKFDIEIDSTIIITKK